MLRVRRYTSVVTSRSPRSWLVSGVVAEGVHVPSPMRTCLLLWPLRARSSAVSGKGRGPRPWPPAASASARSGWKPPGRRPGVARRRQRDVGRALGLGRRRGHGVLGLVTKASSSCGSIQTFVGRWSTVDVQAAAVTALSMAAGTLSPNWRIVPSRSGEALVHINSRTPSPYSRNVVERKGVCQVTRVRRAREPRRVRPRRRISPNRFARWRSGASRRCAP